VTEPLVYTVGEAAELLRIGRTAAYEAARRGDLPTVRIGRTLRIPRHALLRMLGDHASNEHSVATIPRPGELGTVRSDRDGTV